VAVIEDRKTRDYFDRHTPHFSNAGRLQFAIDHVNRSPAARGSLINLGCGDGSTLEVFQRGAELSRLVGMDVSDRYLGLARDRVRCETILGSILDRPMVEQHASSFDFAVLSQILHHLIGPTRTVSHALARQAVEHALLLLRPGGSLIVFEPSYSPRALMTAVFWLKRGLSALSSDRIEIFQKWANIGQPIVSYYTPGQLRAMLRGMRGTELGVDRALATRRVGGVLQFTLLGLVATKGAQTKGGDAG